MQFKKIIKDSSFINAVKLSFSEPKKLGLMVLYDCLFIASFYALYQLLYFFGASLVVKPVSYLLFIAMLAIFVVLCIIYYLVIILVYSFFKFSILDIISSLFDKKESQNGSFGRFYLLNIIITGIFLAFFILLFFIKSTLKDSYQPFFLIIAYVPYGLYLYAVINTSHSLFFEGVPIKNTLNKSFGIIFTKIWVYFEILAAMALFAVIIMALSFGGGYLIRLASSHDNILYIRLFGYFTEISLVVFDALLYFMIVINRISFYEIMKNFNNIIKH